MILYFSSINYACSFAHLTNAGAFWASCASSVTIHLVQHWALYITLNSTVISFVNDEVTKLTGEHWLLALHHLYNGTWVPVSPEWSPHLSKRPHRLSVRPLCSSCRGEARETIPVNSASWETSKCKVTRIFTNRKSLCSTSNEQWIPLHVERNKSILCFCA